MKIQKAFQKFLRKFYGRIFRLAVITIYNFICKRYKERRIIRLNRAVDLMKTFLDDNRLHLRSCIKKYRWKVVTAQRFIRGRAVINLARVLAMTPIFLKIEEMMIDEKKFSNR